MLNDPAASPDPEDPENLPLFELYIMHSKGVCTVNVRRSDLGWKKDGEPIHPVEAEANGAVTVNAMKPPAAHTEDTSTGGDTSAPKSSSDRSARESIKKESSSASRQSMTPEAAMRASTLAKVESKQDAARAAIINGSEKTEKKKKKRSNAETASQASSATRPPSYAQAAQRGKSPSPHPTPATEPATTSILPETEAPEWAKRLISQHFQSAAPTSSVSSVEPDFKKLEENISSEISKGLTRELESLYRRFDEDKRVQAAANAAKQDAVLRLVSSTLTENVDKSLMRMVNESVRENLLPQLVSSTTSSLDRNIAKGLKSSLDNVLPEQLKGALPVTVGKVMQDPQVLGQLSDVVAKKVTTQVGPIVSASLGSALAPALTNLSKTIDHQVAQQLHQADMQRQKDSVKIDQLSNLVRGLTETIQSMAESQSQFQNQLLKMQQTLAQSQGRQSPMQRSSPTVTRSPAKSFKTPEQQEEENITRLMSEGNYEDGTMAVSKDLISIR